MDDCEFSEYNIYNIPEISFVGGSQQEYIFHFYESDLITPVSINWATSIIFSITKFGEPNNVLLSVNGQKVNESPYNSIRILLLDEDTLGLYGKFVYQISLFGSYGTIIPIQGLLNIHKQISST